MSIHLHTALPSLDGVTDWINHEPDIKEISRNPLLVYFWAISCHICHENMPTLQTWREKYVPKGLMMVSIHCPRMKTDTDMEKIKSAVSRYGILEPCGIDNLHKVKKAFDNEYWPAYFLFDREGNLRRRTAGKTGLSMLEPVLEKLCIYALDEGKE